MAPRKSAKTSKAKKPAATPRKPRVTKAGKAQTSKASKDSIPDQDACQQEDTAQESSPLSKTFDDEFILQIFMALSSPDVIQARRSTVKNSQRKLSTLKRKLRYLHGRTTEMIEWLNENKNRLIEEAIYPDEEAAAIATELDEYNERLPLLADAMSNVDLQGKNIEQPLKDHEIEARTLTEEITHRLLRLIGSPEEEWEKLQDKLGWEKFQITEPIDKDSLRIYEQDCTTFVEQILTKMPRLNGKYPAQPTDDAQLHRDQLRSAKELYDRIPILIEDLEKEKVAGESINSLGRTLLEGHIQTCKDTLTQAVEGCRFAGVPCTSEGELVHVTFDANGIYCSHGVHTGWGDTVEGKRAERYLVREK